MLMSLENTPNPKPLFRTNGTPTTYFSLKQLSVGIAKRLASDYDMIVVITGRKGNGKSTLACQIAKCMDPAFSFRRNVIFNFSFQNLEDKVLGLPDGVPIVVDEAVKTLHRQEFYDKQQIEIYKLMTTARKKHKCLILCIPTINRLSASFMNDLVDVWIEVYDRGSAVVWTRDKMSFNDDPWFLKEHRKTWIEFAKRRKIANIARQQYISFYRRLPNYLMDIFWPQFGSAEKEEYLRMVAEAEGQQAQDVEIKVSDYKHSILTLALKLRENLSYPSVLQALGMDEARLIALVGKGNTKAIQKGK